MPTTVTLHIPNTRLEDLTVEECQKYREWLGVKMQERFAPIVVNVVEEPGRMEIHTDNFQLDTIRIEHELLDFAEYCRITCKEF